MRNIYTETIGLCPICAKDSPAFYEEREDGMFFRIECDVHDISTEKVECDSQFFKQMYELEYKRCVRHLVFPITYNCDLKCKYCYTLSNSSLPLPQDRESGEITNRIKDFNGNVTLIGGEPTLREDLLNIIRSAKEVMGTNILSLGTNGLKLSDSKYIKELKESGLDFVFFSLNDIKYEGLPTKQYYKNKIEAMNNCLKLRMPVWLHRTIDNLDQMVEINDLLETYKKIIFNVTIRIVKRFGLYYPHNQVFPSEILKYFKKEDDYTKGVSPFNCDIRLKGKKTKICSWVQDMKRLDPIDSSYIISNDMLTTFHRGMKMDEILLSTNNGLS